jgi:hypothetical protein
MYVPAARDKPPDMEAPQLKSAVNKLVHSSYSLRHNEDPGPFTRKDLTGIPRLFWDLGVHSYSPNQATHNPANPKDAQLSF